MKSILSSNSRKCRSAVLSLVFVVFASCVGMAQKPATEASGLHEMLATKQGPLAIDSPKGWTRVGGMGMAFFVPYGKDAKTADAWIYISSAPIGPSQEYGDIASYIQYDVSAFKEKFPHATVQRETPVPLPNVKLRALIYTFQSGDKDNAYEQVVYIGEKRRVLMLDLSAKNSDAFLQAMPVFREFVRSYRGSENKTDSDKKKP